MYEDSHSEESQPPFACRKQVFAMVEEESLDKKEDCLKETPGDEILRCERHRRKVKPVPAVVDPAKKDDRFPLRMTSPVGSFAGDPSLIYTSEVRKAFSCRGWSSKERLSYSAQDDKPRSG